jgi:hypothetical protein
MTTSPGTPERKDNNSQGVPLRDNPHEDNNVTKMMCATTHLQGSFADQVVDTLVDPMFVANAPSWGVDMVALTRHAMYSLRRRRLRDKYLRYNLVITQVMILLILASWPLGGVSPFRAIGFAFAAFFIGWGLAWRSVFNHYEDIRQKAWWAWNGKDTLLRDQLNEQTDPRGLADLDASIEKRVDEMSRANVVVFGGHNPFVGEGVPLDSWTMSLDLNPDLNWADREKEVRAFTIPQLYEHMLDTVPPAYPGLVAGKRLYVLGTGAKSVPGLVKHPPSAPTCRRETTLRHTCHLECEEDRCDEARPAYILAPDTINRYVAKPTEGFRTYLWFSVGAWSEELRVTILLRAHLTGEAGESEATKPWKVQGTPGTDDTLVDPVTTEASSATAENGEDMIELPDRKHHKQRLFIEGRAHALLALQPVFRDVKIVPGGKKDPRPPGNATRRSWLVVFRPSFSNTISLWFSSWNRHIAWRIRVAAFMRRVWRRRKDLSDDVDPLNYGASAKSLREDAMDAAELKSFASADEVQQFTAMTRTVLDKLRDFLVEQNVDLMQFNQQYETILHQTSVRLHSVKGAKDSFGKATTVLVSQGVVD